MLDLKELRRDPETARARLAARGDGARTGRAVDRILALDEERRALVQEGDDLKRRRNEVSREVAGRGQRGEEAGELIARMKGVAGRIKELDDRLREREKELDDLLLRLPNLPLPGVPAGGEDCNRVVREWGEKAPAGEDRPTHWEIGERLGIIDLPAGARVAGRGFPVFRGAGARLQRALVQWMLDLHTSSHGYTEVSPPYLVNRKAMTGTGQYPKFVEDGDAYAVEPDGLYLVPTSEVPLVNLHREEILDAGQLPIRYTAYSPCFRREAGAAGKDTRGLLRVHQFDKVELVRFERPEQSPDALEEITSHAEEVLKQLRLAYRVVLLAAGDTGFAAAQTYDLEVWAPGVGRWLEVSSASNCADFQARRASVRLRPQGGGKPEYVHTLNASGVALPRTVVALLENGLQADGSVTLPDVLHPYLGSDRISPVS
ncbi:MAG: serine--tRNA ligase [Longimicrobiaceae bacterium]